MKGHHIPDVFLAAVVCRKIVITVPKALREKAAWITRQLNILKFCDKQTSGGAKRGWESRGLGSRPVLWSR